MSPYYFAPRNRAFGFNPKLQFNRIFIFLDTNQNNYIWKSDSDIYFTQTSEDMPDWIETKDGKAAYTFITYTEKFNDEIILFDKSRGYYVKLTSSNSQLSITDISNDSFGILYYGKWIQKNGNSYTPSKFSYKSFDFIIENNLSNSVNVFWSDYYGNLVYYGYIDANEKITFLSFEGHSWIIKNGNNEKRELILGKQPCLNLNCAIKVADLKFV